MAAEWLSTVTAIYSWVCSELWSPHHAVTAALFLSGTLSRASCNLSSPDSHCLYSTSTEYLSAHYTFTCPIWLLTFANRFILNTSIHQYITHSYRLPAGLTRSLSSCSNLFLSSSCLMKRFWSSTWFLGRSPSSNISSRMPLAWERALRICSPPWMSRFKRFFRKVPS